MTTQIDITDEVNLLESNEQINVTVQKTKKSKKPSYSIVGNGRVTKDFSNTIDALELFGSLSPSQQKIVLHFRDEIERNKINAFYQKVKLENPNIVKLSKSSLEEVDKNIKKLLRANINGKTLIEKGVIKKIKTNEYMLNPYMFIPHDEFERIAQIWEEIVSK